MDAIANVETVGQVGMIKVTGGIALYVAHIRQMDRDRQLSPQTRGIRQTGPVEHLDRG